MLTIKALLTFVVLSLSCFETQAQHPEAELTFEERAWYHGYPTEIHQLETEDGYVLMLYRIPYGLNQQHGQTKNKSAVLILHGNGGSPHNFLVLGRRRAAAFYFADKGLDVWLLAARGIPGSITKKHKVYNWDKDPEYWHFSHHEIGVYDVPAAIDRIIQVTDQKKVFLVGHSSGGMQCYSLLSEKPEYNRKVKLVMNWGSSPVIQRVDFPLLAAAASIAPIIKGFITQFLGFSEVPFHKEIIALLRKWCVDPHYRKLCYHVIYSVGSHNTVLMRPQDTELIVASIPRLSIQQILHLLDNVFREGARKYDHGPERNINLYGQTVPPEYNLSAATVPTAFFVATKDGFIGKENMELAIRRLPSTVYYHEVQFSKFNHLDFIFGINATELVYEPTYQLFRDIDRGLIPAKVKLPPVVS